MELKLYSLDEIDLHTYTTVVIVSRFKNKWIFCKHKSRDTWEIAGGHVEDGEHWLDTAKRELFEETGATKANIEPVCLFSISTYGLLCFAEIEELSKLPNFEIERIDFFDTIPENLTYPDSHPILFEKAKQFADSKTKI